LSRGLGDVYKDSVNSALRPYTNEPATCRSI
jgi:hypothetical protein